MSVAASCMFSTLCRCPPTVFKLSHHVSEVSRYGKPMMIHPPTLFIPSVPPVPPRRLLGRLPSVPFSFLFVGRRSVRAPPPVGGRRARGRRGGTTSDPSSAKTRHTTAYLLYFTRRGPYRRSSSQHGSLAFLSHQWFPGSHRRQK
ncbi:hypothetical protein LZ31DRAFT_288012 [Colletotrichum somersetense]|nr:hypothetical protein LZ31DRAFT_288012 [Colletotrichum somersetense]